MNEQLQLIEAAQRGSVGAFEQLIIGVERQMLALAAGLANFPDEADDIFQEAVLNAYRALPKFRGDSQFSTWLYRIFVNTAMRYQSKLSHRWSRHASPDYESETASEYYSVSSKNSPHQEEESRQIGSAIHKAMQQLSDQERVAFVLCHQQEISISEAAAIMECSDGSVKSYVFRAREKMRKQLHMHYTNTTINKQSTDHDTQ